MQNAFLADLISGLETEGVYLESFRKDPFIQKFDLSCPDSYLPTSVQDKILLAVDNELGANSLVTEHNRYFRSTNMGRISSSMYNASSLLDFVNLAVKYQKLMRSDHVFSFIIQGPVSTFGAKIDSEPTEARSILGEVDISRIVDAFWTVIGRDFVPLEIGTTAKTTEYLESIFPAGNYDIKVGQDLNWISFDSRYLSSRPPRLYNDHQVPRGTEHTGPMASKIERLLESFLPGYVPNLNEIAAMFGCARRTIERDLGKEQTTYQAVKESFLMRKSIELINDPRYSVKAIAECLDYSNAQNFIRSFRTWFRMTPLQYRDSL